MRSTNVTKVRLVNAAFRLLERGTDLAEAAERLSREFALSRRQAYRYLEQASRLSEPLPAIEPTIAMTIKVPVSTARALRRLARQRGRTIGEIVTDAITGLVDSRPRHG